MSNQPAPSVRVQRCGTDDVTQEETGDCYGPLRRPAALDWPARIANYERVMQRPAYMSITNGWVYGVWFMGQSWRVPSGYYGGYPGDFLKRIAALFPDKRRVLHLFAGKVEQAVLPGDTLDCRPELQPTWCVNAETCEGVPLDTYDLVVADPPYSAEDADHYGTPMVNRDRVMRVLAQRTAPGCHIAWLDQVLPRYRKAELKREAAIGLSRSTGHRFRVVSIFRRQPHLDGLA